MAGRKKDITKRKLEPEQPPDQDRDARVVRARIAGGAIGLVALIVAVIVVVVASGGNDSPGGDETATDEVTTYAHVHGLGVNPADSALFIATHDGLFRSAEGDDTAARVGESEQDVMGFSVVGENEFVGSGHPGPSQGGPSSLGLIRSTDSGEQWQNVSLLGEADFHILRAKDEYVYGYSGGFGVSSNRGQTWESPEMPGDLFDLAIDPVNAQHVVAMTTDGVFESRNAGGAWRKTGESKAGLLAWPKSKQLFIVEESGAVSVSSNVGGKWTEAGSANGQPVAFTGSGGDLFVALADNNVMKSADGGATWALRTSP